MRPLPPEAARQFDVFRADQAIRHAWTSHALRHAARIGSLDRLARGVYARPVPASVPTYDAAIARFRQQAVAVALSQSRVVLSHTASAAIDDLPLLGVPRRVCVTSSRALRGGVAGARIHHGALPRSHVTRRGLIACTSVARTVADVARENGADDGLVAADAALSQKRVVRADLDAVVRYCAGWPGVVSARRVALYADGRSESALESLSRLRMAELGLPPPDLQVSMYCDGRFLGRPDFYWDEFGVIGEADGMQKYDGSTTSLREEKRRQGELENAGLIVVRWVWSDLSAFDDVAQRLRSAFVRGLRPDRAPRLWTPARYLGGAVN